MATIYRFIVEQKTSKGGDGRKSSGSSGGSKGAGKKKYVTLLGQKGGVEHNRKLRAINPLLNRMTGGWWEKGMRLGRAGMGLIKFDKTTGAFAGVSWTAIAIIIAFMIQVLMKWQQKEIKKAREANTQNFKQLENGLSGIHGAYKVSTNIWNGRHTYNQNK